MRWFVLLFNILAAAVFLFIGVIGVAKSQSFVHMIHREMEAQNMIRVQYSESGEETPNVRAQLMTVARANYQSELSFLGVTACLLNGVINFFSFPSSRRKKAEKQQFATSSAQTHPSDPPSG